MEGEVFTIQVSFVSFVVGTASAIAWVVLGLNGHPLEGMLLWLFTALVTLFFARFFYDKHSYLFLSLNILK